MRLLHVVTVPLSFRLLKGQAEHMLRSGVEVHAVASPGPLAAEYSKSELATVHAVPMSRRMDPLGDLVALFRLCALMRRVRPDVVQSGTPKGGLLGSLAAWLTRVPVRIYHVRGLPLLTASGTSRAILRLSERLSCATATHVLCVSDSMRDALVAEGLCHPPKARVLLRGSSNGVDVTRFNPDAGMRERGLELRRRLGIPRDAVVIGFIGRLVRAKGIVELTEAWKAIRPSHPDAHLVLVGPAETDDAVPAPVLAELKGDARVHLTGLEWDTPPLYAAMDVLCLPTYREGFPNVVLEAGAMSLPVAGTRVPGVTDAVVDGVTGILVPPQDSAALASALGRYVSDTRLRARHGQAARAHAIEFQQEKVWDALVAYYADARRKRGARGSARGRGGGAWKRLLDVAGAAVGLALLLPLIAVVALVVRWTLGSPVLFRQQRPGLGGRPFNMLKFRTMTDARGADGRLRSDAERLTALGRFLRASSIDELPELWNVLKGDMSLVGPRPLLMQYLPRYTPEQARRHDVRPGITGLAQVSGRNALSWEEKFALDVEYVDTCSLSLDVKILARTLWSVVARRGISQPGHATAQEFMGSATR